MFPYDLLNGVFNMLLLILLLFLHLRSSVPVPFSYHEARTLPYFFCHPRQCLQPFTHNSCNKALDLISSVCVRVRVCVCMSWDVAGGPYQQAILWHPHHSMSIIQLGFGTICPEMASDFTNWGLSPTGLSSLSSQMQMPEDLLCFWPSIYSLEVPMTLSLALINLLEHFTELKRNILLIVSFLQKDITQE